MLSFKQFLTEGGAGGHVLHPFDIANTGQELIDLFVEAINYIKTGKAGEPGSSWVKLDGINMSVKIVDGEFRLDRGSSKELDIRGMRPDDFENRGLKPGFIENARILFAMLDKSYDSTKKELSDLGVTDSRIDEKDKVITQTIINLEFVGENQTNVIKYKIPKFIAIHGLRKSTYDTTTNKRTIIDIPTPSADILERYVNSLNKVTEKFNFLTIGNPSVKEKKKINIDGILSKNITLNNKNQSLRKWLEEIKEIPKKNGRAIIFKKAEFKNILSGDNQNLTDNEVRDFILYKATIDLGDVLLKSLTSDLGDLHDQEGLMVKRKNGQIFKITGNFILRGPEETKFGANTNG